MYDVIWEALSLSVCVRGVRRVYARVRDEESVSAHRHQPAWQLCSFAVIGRKAVIPSVTIRVAPSGGHRPPESSLFRGAYQRRRRASERMRIWS